MKEFIKTILKAAGIYHPMQRFYRQTLFRATYKKIRKEFEKHRGHGLSCNICEASYKTFAPKSPAPENKRAIESNHVIAGFGENVFCPNCMSTARERLIIAMLGRMNISGKRILHLSPEENIYRYLAGRANVVTADLEPGFYKSIDKKVQKADATKLSFDDETFDMVIGNHIMEHIPDDRKAMQEIFRVLKAAGVAILQVPFSTTISTTIEEPAINNPKRQSEFFGQRDHVRIYSRQNYMDRLKSTGFRVEYLAHESLSAFHSFAIQPGEGFFSITK